MAKAKQANKNSSGKKKQGLLSRSRKIELIGISIMAISVLLAISILTYRSEDYSVVSTLGLADLFRIDQGAALRIQNGLGPVGAFFAHYLVYVMFGYASMVLAGVLFLYGWNLFRQHELTRVHGQAVFGILVMILLSTIFGWLHHGLGMDTELYGGTSGVALAQLLRSLTGPYGPYIILGALSIMALLLLVDRDIQVSIDRFREFLARRREIRAQNKKARAAAADAAGPGQEDAVDRSASAERTDAGASDGKAVSAAAGYEGTGYEGNSYGEQELEDIVESSRQAERERIQAQKNEDEAGERQHSRAVLDKGGRDDSKQEREPDESGGETGRKPEGGGDSEGEDLDIEVYVGKKEEEAGDQDLRREQKNKDVPVVKYQFPGLDLLADPPNEGNEVDFEEINANKMVILDKLQRHGIEITGIEAVVGPTVTLYELQPAPDVKISKIESYANDLKMAMATKGLRIIAPIPGKSKVGIEVPNRKRETVYIKSLIKTRRFVESDMELPVAFGRTIENEVFMLDLNTLPHLLIAGATGSGKSVGINTIITCLLYKCHPENLKFVLVDPKKIELALYRNIETHFLAKLPEAEEPIVTDNARVLEVLNSVCKEMDHRYELLKKAMVRDIKAYNAKFQKGELSEEEGHRHLPYIVVIIDEMADLMLTAGKKLEEPIARIAQLARAVGIHMVLATQRPSVNVITGTIKANFPARIAYRVASKVDSRTILDTMGADQLVGKGDMLFAGGAGMVRIQNALVSTEDVERISQFIGEQQGYRHPYHLPEPDDAEGQQAGELGKEERDELFEEAAKIMVLHRQGSVSLLQRKLKLGYNRAGRLIDQLYSAGVVGPYKGSSAREVMVENEDELQDLLRSFDD